MKRHLSRLVRTPLTLAACLVLAALPAYALDPPVLQSPPNYTFDPTPLFRWYPVVGATTYRLAIHLADGDTNHYETTTTGTSWTLPSSAALASESCYYWWVRAETKSDIGPWSDLGTVCYGPRLDDPAPKPLAPRGWEENLKPRFEWTADPVAVTYRLTVHPIDGTPSFDIVTSATHFTPTTDLETDKCYNWSVRSERPGDYGAWSKPFGICMGPGPPRFEDVVYTSPLAGMTPKELDAVMQMHNMNFAAFAAAYYPKLGLPVERHAFRGIWFYRSWPDGTPNGTVYDGNACSSPPCPPIKPTYPGHEGTDFWVDLFDYCTPRNGSSCGTNYVISPFPAGAQVWVESIVNIYPEGTQVPSPGNTLKLVCYLDGVRDPSAPAWRKMTIDFFHVLKDSFLVQVGDQVTPGQRLAEVGLTGNTGQPGLHLHMQLFGNRDPFDGIENVDLTESLFWDQPSVERIANYQKLGEGHQNLRIDGDYLTTRVADELSTYTFSSTQPIEKLMVAETSQGPVTPPVDLLTYLPSVGITVLEGTDTKVVAGITYHLETVRFNWQVQSPMPGEWAFYAVDGSGNKSNLVWIDYLPEP
ncbi:MAG: M23 family metallopeptidase [Acidobacteriota bacterium]